MRVCGVGAWAVINIAMCAVCGVILHWNLLRIVDWAETACMVGWRLIFPYTRKAVLWYDVFGE